MTGDNQKKNIAIEVARGDEANVASLLAQLQRFRQDADYSAEIVFTPEMATRELEAARTFVATARELLSRGGWLGA